MAGDYTDHKLKLSELADNSLKVKERDRRLYAAPPCTSERYLAFHYEVSLPPSLTQTFKSLNPMTRSLGLKKIQSHLAFFELKVLSIALPTSLIQSPTVPLLHPSATPLLHLALLLVGHPPLPHRSRTQYSLDSISNPRYLF